MWLAVLAAVTYAVGVLAQKPLLGRLPGPEVTWLACIIGAVVCLPWSGELLTVVRESDASTLLWIGYLGVFPTAVAFSTWAWVLARSEAGTLTLTTFLVPFIATLIAWALLGEVPPPLTFVGGALCIAGVLLTRRRPKVAESTREPEPVATQRESETGTGPAARALGLGAPTSPRGTAGRSSQPPGAVLTDHQRRAGVRGYVGPHARTHVPRSAGPSREEADRGD